jgi:DNA-binding Xre family transcriptional regulator
MAASYKPLFKLLIDRNMKKKELAERAGVSLATITKMGKAGTVVTTDVLVKICVALNCNIGDIVEIIPNETA